MPNYNLFPGSTNAPPEDVTHDIRATLGVGAVTTLTDDYYALPQDYDKTFLLNNHTLVLSVLRLTSSGLFKVIGPGYYYTTTTKSVSLRDMEEATIYYNHTTKTPSFARTTSALIRELLADDPTQAREALQVEAIEHDGNLGSPVIPTAITIGELEVCGSAEFDITYQGIVSDGAYYTGTDTNGEPAWVGIVDGEWKFSVADEAVTWVSDQIYRFPWDVDNWTLASGTEANNPIFNVTGSYYSVVGAFIGQRLCHGSGSGALLYTWDGYNWQWEGNGTLTTVVQPTTLTRSLVEGLPTAYDPPGEYIGQPLRYGDSSPYVWYTWDGTDWARSGQGLEVVALTEAEYNALTDEEREDPTKWYVVTDV